MNLLQELFTKVAGEQQAKGSQQSWWDSFFNKPKPPIVSPIPAPSVALVQPKQKGYWYGEGNDPAKWYPGEMPTSGRPPIQPQPKIQEPVTAFMTKAPETQKPQPVTGGRFATSPDYLSRIQGIYRATAKNPEQYFPVYSYLPSFIDAELKYNRPGLAALLSLQALHESTGGVAKNNFNIFGAKPGGEGGRSARFKSIKDALDYQLGPYVLGGGANPNMSILKRTGLITVPEIIKLYKSYNPSADYLRPLLDEYAQITGLR